MYTKLSVLKMNQNGVPAYEIVEGIVSVIETMENIAPVCKKYENWILSYHLKTKTSDYTFKRAVNFLLEILCDLAFWFVKFFISRPANYYDPIEVWIISK